MCAIFGVVGEVERDLAVKALQTLAHRGSDEEKIYEKEGLFLGHRRLYILNPKAHQPLEREGKVALFNGEIYNYKELKALSEIEAIIQSYPNFSKLDGMFAFGLYDGKRLFLGRDIFGKKPLFYYVDKSRFVFSSEIKGIVSYLGQKRFKHKALSGYLSFGALPDRHTFYQDISKLLPGELLIYDSKTKKITHSELGSFLQTKSKDLEEGIHRGIQKRLQGDFPVASLLSGGVDSSLVAALAKKEQGSLATFSIGYEEEHYSELPYARLVAQHIGSDHTEVLFGKEEFFATFEELLGHFDEPIGDSASVPLAYLFGQIKKSGFRVVLSGEGGDEIFLGYRQYFEFLDMLQAKNLKYKNWLKNYFRSHFSPNKEWEWYKRIFSDELLFRSTCEVFTDLQKNLFLRQNVRDGESVEFLEPFLRRWERSGLNEESIFMSYIDMMVRLAALYLAKLDTTSMLHTIEARTPLLDREIVAAAFGNPKRAKEPKFLLKQIAAKYIPDEIIGRKKKGFSYPHMQWLMQSDYIQRMERINDEAGFFKPDQLSFLIENAKRNRFSRHFWLALAFLLWYEKNF